jgi:hypothetical protein
LGQSSFVARLRNCAFLNLIVRAAAMGFLTSLFGSTRTRRTTANEPLRLNDPTLGFLNLMGEGGEALMEIDANVLSPLFNRTLKSSTTVPSCQVLFIYCELDAEGHIKGHRDMPTDLIKTAHAYVAVIASENSGASYIKAVKPRKDWHANVAMVLDRKGDKLARFFQKVFAGMFEGRSMLILWAELAPQGPGPRKAEAPGTILAATAGHITFR